VSLQRMSGMAEGRVSGWTRIIVGRPLSSDLCKCLSNLDRSPHEKNPSEGKSIISVVFCPFVVIIRCSNDVLSTSPQATPRMTNR